MGTNYYAFGPHKGTDPEEGLHIGKSSVGWKFMFRAYPSLQITSLGQWVDYFSRPDVRIVNEYGSEIPLSEMIRTMTEQTDSDGTPLRDHSAYREGEERFSHNGYDFSIHDFC